MRYRPTASPIFGLQAQQAGYIALRLRTAVRACSVQRMRRLQPEPLA